MTSHRQKKIPGARGNALFIILIAIALTAALAFAVTMSGRGNSGDNREEVSLAVAEMISYAGKIEKAIVRMRTLRNCTIRDSGGTVSAYSAEWAVPSRYENASAPSDEHCHIFSPQGGQVEWRPPPQLAQDGTGITEYGIARNVEVRGVGTDNGATTEDQDLLFVAKVTKEMCEHINHMEGIPGAPPPDMDNMDFPLGATRAYDGSFTDNANIGAGASASVFGHRRACLSSTNDSGYRFYYVLVAR